MRADVSSPRTIPRPASAGSTATSWSCCSPSRDLRAGRSRAASTARRSSATTSRSSPGPGGSLHERGPGARQVRATPAPDGVLVSASFPRAGSGAQPERGVARGSAEGRAFLDPEVVARLAHLDVRARLVVEGFIAGMHRSPFHGFSVEFSEHRPYMPGDPLKNLDWKVLAKSDRYLVKQYTEETNLRAHLLLDLSGSMGFRSERASLSKLEYARSLAAALAYLMIGQQDAVGAMLFAERPLQYVPPRSVRSHLDVVLKCLAHGTASGRTRLAPALHELAERIKRRGLVVLLSDLLDSPAEVLSGLQHFRHRNHEVIVFHVLRSEEHTS